MRFLLPCPLSMLGGDACGAEDNMPAVKLNGWCHGLVRKGLGHVNRRDSRITNSRCQVCKNLMKLHQAVRQVSPQRERERERERSGGPSGELCRISSCSVLCRNACSCRSKADDPCRCKRRGCLMVFINVKSHATSGTCAPYGGLRHIYRGAHHGGGVLQEN